MTAAEIISKFGLLASKVLKQSQIERLLDTVQSLRHVADIKLLGMLTRRL